jgi:phosphoglycolate phosphatase
LRGGKGRASRRVALCFDIDGTLLTTARAGVIALEDAAEEVCGGRPDLAGMKTAGLTDGQIARLVIEECTGAPANGRIEAFLSTYERRLPDRLPLRRGQVLPGVEETLSGLAGRDDVVCLLLTGNTEAGAAAKLSHYGLAGYFEGGSFCRAGESRESIAARARQLVEERLGAEPTPETFFVVGDTPADVSCAKAVGARAVAVASGDYDVAALEATHPWQTVPRMPGADWFTGLLATGG